ncbi:unnamed protein product [Caenorhabditis angaria]|uniref:Uncharacterized protein n=1 Tax=Caenorhabditis angaria TaxID=860376 RepID=A0A9P1N5W9_9PELO|nr:unnamed protein product [Caenorhabditis angaria]
MCIGKRKSIYRENAVVTKKGSKGNQYNNHHNNGGNNDAPLVRGSNGGSGAQNGGENGQQRTKDGLAANIDENNNNPNQINNNNAQSPADYRPSKKRNDLGKSQQKTPCEDDTLTNIPDEMPEMELNRDKGEPFYTDDQLL